MRQICKPIFNIYFHTELKTQTTDRLSYLSKRYIQYNFSGSLHAPDYRWFSAASNGYGHIVLSNLVTSYTINAITRNLTALLVDWVNLQNSYTLVKTDTTINIANIKA